MAEFKDPETGEIINVAVSIYSYSNKYYMDKFRQPLLNKNGIPLQLVEKEKDWSDEDSYPNFTSFNSKSSDEKKKILSKRSNSMDIQSNRELRDKKDWIDGKDLIKRKK